ncbi:unnamed protein product [Protopolystoma xenopodis]|uniref:Uncharacterized protein n=1 Tax=Protopolystoma xenopodis TaxID=117903 RepID=A0A448WM73_9PLAT|nr:unnamed protein product [Protopolystoma xenopodis]
MCCANLGSHKWLTFLKTAGDTLDLPAIVSSSSSSKPDHGCVSRCKQSMSFCATILIRGSDMSTLILVQRCLLFAIHICYNGHLEKSCMRDMGICFTPAASQTGLDELETNVIIIDHVKFFSEIFWLEIDTFTFIDTLV